MQYTKKYKIPITEENFRSVLKNHFEEYKRTKKAIRAGDYPIFDLLHKTELLKMEGSEKLKMYQEEQKRLISLPENEHRRSIYQGNRSNTVIFHTKARALQEFYDSLIEMNLNIEDIFENE